MTTPRNNHGNRNPPRAPIKRKRRELDVDADEDYTAKRKKYDPTSFFTKEFDYPPKSSPSRLAPPTIIITKTYPKDFADIKMDNSSDSIPRSNTEREINFFPEKLTVPIKRDPGTIKENNPGFLPYSKWRLNQQNSFNTKRDYLADDTSMSDDDTPPTQPLSLQPSAPQSIKTNEELIDEELIDSFMLDNEDEEVNRNDLAIVISSSEDSFDADK